MALGWVHDIEQETLGNDTFRTVLFTGDHLQLTVMSIPPGGEIGEEVHELKADWAASIPAGVWHNVVNIGWDELKLYSLYAPPHHPDGTVHQTKADSDAAED